ncbi:uncharacterized protein L201_001352 [Kwoniella dendrophila CBS 6074]|uniref:Uncharacterized protein n=1 Tax=Kwoniella dendrophila CBS 6074 TaxID=1295534 RepID=A0AAX4JPJ5_9TREE
MSTHLNASYLNPRTSLNTRSGRNNETYQPGDDDSQIEKEDYGIAQRKDESVKIVKSLTRCMNSLMGKPVIDGVESPYVYQDILKPKNVDPRTWQNHRYGQEVYECEEDFDVANELYDLVIIISMKIAEFLNRLSILIKIIFSVIDLLSLLVRRIDKLEKENKELKYTQRRKKDQSQLIQSMIKRIDRLESKQSHSHPVRYSPQSLKSKCKGVDRSLPDTVCTIEETDGDISKTGFTSQFNQEIALARGGEILSSSFFIDGEKKRKAPPTPPSSTRSRSKTSTLKSSKSSDRREREAFSSINKSSTKPLRRSTRNSSANMFINYKDSSSESEAIEIDDDYKLA